MSGTPKTRAELADNVDSPFAEGKEPAQQDFQDLAASCYNLKDDPGQVSLVSKPLSETLTGVTTTFTQADGTLFLLDAGASNRNFNPSAVAGSFTNGYIVEILNVSAASRNITFTGPGLVVVIPNGQSARIAYYGGSFKLIRLG